MTEFMRRLMVTVVITLLVTASLTQAQKPEYAPVDVEVIKASPQMFWAKGIVFRDVLKQHPDGKSTKIDGRRAIKFKTENLGEVYCEPGVAEQIRNLELGQEYLFAGVVGQRKSRFFGRGKYLAIIQQVTAQNTDASLVPDAISGLNLKNSTNIYNMVFVTLDQIMRAVEKDMFAAANSQGISIQQMFDPAKPQLDRVKTSIRKVLRETEEQSKLPMEEYFISLIVSLMALQHGYTEPAPTSFIPDTGGSTSEAYVAEEPVTSSEPQITRESWDLSEKEANADAASAPAPEPETVPGAPDEAEAGDAAGGAEAEVSPVVAPAESADIENAGIEEVTIEEAVVEEDVELMTRQPEPVNAPGPAIDSGNLDEATNAVSSPVEDDDFWGVTPSGDTIVEGDSVSAPVAGEVPVAMDVVAPVETAPTVETPETESVVEQPADAAVNPALLETESEVVPEKPKKPAKKKKTAKKKPVTVEKEVEITTPTVPEQDEIDYSKPIRVK